MRTRSFGTAGAGGWLLAVTALAFAAPGTGPLAAQERPVELDTLRVVGTRAGPAPLLRTRSITVLDRAAIRELPVANVPDLLRWIPGVEVGDRSPAQADVSIRGAGFEQVLVLVDGRRVSDRQTGHFDLNLPVPLERIERVEVLRGPASAAYGADAVGGVINIVTGDGGDSWSVRGEGGSFGTGLLSAQGSLAPSVGSTLAAGAEYARSDGHRPGTDYELLTVDVEGTVRAGRGQLQVGAGHTRRDFGAEDFYAPFPSWEESRASTASVRWEGEVGGGIRLEPGVFVRRHDDDFLLDRDEPEGPRNVHRSVQGGGELTLRRAGSLSGGAGPIPALAVGVEAYRDRLRSSNLGDRSEDRAALFGEVGGTLDAVGAGALAGSAGLRLDWHEGFGAVVSPSASASLDPRPGLRVRLAGGRSFRAPSWTERHYTDPAHQARAELDPEESWSGEVGVEVRPVGSVRVEVTGFLRHSRDLIDWARPRGEGDEVQWETRNVEEARFRGFEASVGQTGFLGAEWGVEGSLLSLRAAENEELVSKQALRPLTEEFLARVSRRVGPLTMGVQGLRARRPGDSPHTRVDLRGSVPAMGGRVHLDVRNLMDSEYPDITGSPAPGRSIVVGFSVNGGASVR